MADRPAHFLISLSHTHRHTHTHAHTHSHGGTGGGRVCFLTVCATCVSFLSKPNGDVVATAPKCPEEGGEVDQFDGVALAPEKLSHPTADRAKPPGRRPPSGLVSPGPVIHY